MMKQAAQTSDGFKLGVPALVCRWRLAGGALPLENRHLRALSRRAIGGEPVSAALVAWAKQHIEWTLNDGAARYPDGVLMLVIDGDGQAAMTVGPYEGLGRSSLSSLLVRARSSWREGEETGIAPESLWIADDDGLAWGLVPGASPSGANALIEDLVQTLGIPLRRDEQLLDDLGRGDIDPREAFLVSDEHGVVCAGDCAGDEGKRLGDGYVRLLEKTRDQRRKRGGTSAGA